MSKNIIFDIESGPEGATVLSGLMPTFTAPANYKDAEKITAHIADQQKEWIEKAALSPLTGRVLAIGLMIGDVPRIYMEEDEENMLHRFWQEFLTNYGTANFIGFNVKRFDLPFLLRRSFKYGLTVPKLFNRRYWIDDFIDLYETWQCGNYQDSISLANLSKYLGVGEKLASGKDFAGMNEADRTKYLTHDLELTLGCAKKLHPDLFSPTLNPQPKMEERI